jgi:aspartate/methionine/tyrosine aminotransferase
MHGSASIGASPTLALGARVDALRRAGIDAVSLSSPEFGAPPPPGPLGDTHAVLTDAAGNRALAALARAALFGPWTLPRHVPLVTAGAKAALFAILRSVVSPGERIGLVTPCWPSYRQLARLVHAAIVPIPTRLEDGWRPDPQAIRTAARTGGGRLRAVIVANPCNPTGRVLDGEAIAALLAAAADAGAALVLDESFSRFRFGAARRHDTRPALPDDAPLFLVNSFSKNFELQGYRLGAALVPRGQAEAVLAIHQAVCSAASSIAQAAVLALDRAGALRTPDLSAQRATILSFIAETGWPCHATEGGFYAFPRLDTPSDIAERFTRAGFVWLDGAAFGADPAFIRLCFARPLPKLLALRDRLREALA